LTLILTLLTLPWHYLDITFK